MTVQYTATLSTTTHFGFLRMVFKWRGSIYKLIWKDMFLFLVLYYALFLMYRFVLPPQNKRQFEDLATYCFNFSNLVPLSFVLGFYVMRVVSRFWEQFNTLPWPVKPAIYVSSYVRGRDDYSRLLRRTLMRYLILALVMTLSSISPQIKKRFPSLKHLTDAGFLLPNEQVALENVNTSSNKYFVPIVWATTVVNMARRSGHIKDDHMMQKLIAEINEFRGACGQLFSYDNVTVPLVYTQVVTVAVYIYVIACLFGRRTLDGGLKGDFNVPFFTLLQLMVYQGWLKVAECLLNPFGDDDDDFEVNPLIDRHLQEAFLVVDTIYEELPKQLKDMHWNQTAVNMPYSESTQHLKKEVFVGTATSLEIPASKQQFVNLNDEARRKSSMLIMKGDKENVTKARSSTSRTIFEDAPETPPIAPIQTPAPETSERKNDASAASDVGKKEG